MADLELAETSKTAPSALITPPQVVFPGFLLPKFRDTLVDLELAETSKTAPSALITPPQFVFPDWLAKFLLTPEELERLNAFTGAPSARIAPPLVVSRGGLPPNFRATLVNPFVSSKGAIRLPPFLVEAVLYSPKPILPLRGAPILPDADSVSQWVVLDLLDKAFGFGGFHGGNLLAEVYKASLRPLSYQLVEALRYIVVHNVDLLKELKFAVIVREKILLTRKARKAHQPVKDLSASLCGSGAYLCDPFLPDAHSASPSALRGQPAGAEALASLGARRMLSNQGESSGSGSGSGGRAGGERNGGGGDGNQGIGGGVGGGGGQREGIGNEWRGNRGRNHGGGNGNGDDDGNDRRGLLGFIGGERGPMGPGPYGLAEILLPLNAEMIWTLGSHDIHDLSARARIYRVVSLAFNSGALVSLSASIGQRRTNPRLATILSWIGAFATLLGFISMIAMAFSASFIP